MWKARNLYQVALPVDAVFPWNRIKSNIDFTASAAKFEYHKNFSLEIVESEMTLE